MIYLLIALGGAVGSLSRYVLGRAVQSLSASGFPIGTLVVNVSGCFLIGILVRQFLNMQVSPELRALLIVGFCGGVFTFSTFSAGKACLIVGGGDKTPTTSALLQWGPGLGASPARLTPIRLII